MNEFKVYPISKLPTYLVGLDNIFQESILMDVEDTFDPKIDNITIDVSPNWTPEWVKNNIILGNLGEEIASAYLERQFSQITRISIKNSSDGYDIKADKQCFEVKTSTAKDYAFEITANQLKKANIEKIHYNIFCIFIDRNTKSATGYIINNPLQKFNVKLDELFISITPFEPTGFKVKIENYLYLTEKIDLTSILQSILANSVEYDNFLKNKNLLSGDFIPQL